MPAMESTSKDPTGPIWGRDRLRSGAAAAMLEGLSRRAHPRPSDLGRRAAAWRSSQDGSPPVAGRTPA